MITVLILDMHSAKNVNLYTCIHTNANCVINQTFTIRTDKISLCFVLISLIEVVVCILRCVKELVARDSPTSTDTHIPPAVELLKRISRPAPVPATIQPR